MPALNDPGIVLPAGNSLLLSRIEGSTRPGRGQPRLELFRKSLYGDCKNRCMLDRGLLRELGRGRPAAGQFCLSQLSACYFGDRPVKSDGAARALA